MLSNEQNQAIWTIKGQVMKRFDSFTAYKAMLCFLEKQYEQTKSDDIAALLGSMQLLDDNCTADPAMWSEWEECVVKLLQLP